MYRLFNLSKLDLYTINLSEISFIIIDEFVYMFLYFI